MAADEWIIVPNWGKFQHYGDREPVWIKVYTELNSRDDFLALTRAERGLLLTIWLEFARSRARLRVKTILALCDSRARREHLIPLSDAGFIELSASAPERLPASPRARREEVEEEKEVEAPLPPQDVGAKIFEKPGVLKASGTNPRAQGTNPRAAAKSDREHVHQELLEHARRIAGEWNGGGSDLFDETLDALEAEHHDQLRALERDDLWNQAFNQR
jgi:hypothetical protein